MKKKVTLDSLQKEVEELKEMVRQLLARPNIITISPQPFVCPTPPQPYVPPLSPYQPTWPPADTPISTCGVSLYKDPVSYYNHCIE